MNCGAIPENLIESILFGHEKGAFTGATDKHLGKFQEADGGTLFLDEIGELRLDMQVKLLRALQEGEIDPVGAKRPVKVDVRIISATNRDPERADEGRQVPRGPLSTASTCSRSSCPPCGSGRTIFRRSLSISSRRFAAEENKLVSGFTPEALGLLNSYAWPGNVRQLENTVFRAVVLCDEEMLDVADFPQIAPRWASRRASASLLPSPAPAVRAMPVHAAAARYAPYGVSAADQTGHMRKLEDVESEIIKMAIERYSGRMSEVARRLGIGRSTLYRKLKEYGLEAGEVEANDDGDDAQEEPRGGRSASGPHPERGEIEVEHGLHLLAVGLVEFPHAHDLPHDLGVEAVSLGFGVDLADVGGRARPSLLPGARCARSGTAAVLPRNLTSPCCLAPSLHSCNTAMVRSRQTPSSRHTTKSWSGRQRR